MSAETHTLNDLETCGNCSHCAHDAAPDQCGPAVWCKKGHWEGLSSWDDLDRVIDCQDFKWWQEVKS